MNLQSVIKSGIVSIHLLFFFVNNNQVLFDGACVDVSSCPICTDENGARRSNGDQWQYSGEPCIVASCLPDGSISQNQLQCAPALTCAEGEVSFVLEYSDY